MEDEDLENKARYKFQYQPNKETGQKIGNREIVLDLDEEIFDDYVRDLLKDKNLSFKEYVWRYSDIYVLLFKKYNTEYTMGNTFREEELKTLKNKWNIMVNDFNSEKAVRHSKGIEL